MMTECNQPTILISLQQVYFQMLIIPSHVLQPVMKKVEQNCPSKKGYLICSQMGWPYVHSNSRRSFTWHCKLENFVPGSDCRSMPEAVFSISTSHGCQRGRSWHSQLFFQIQNCKIHQGLKKKTGQKHEHIKDSCCRNETLFTLSCDYLQVHSHCGSLCESQLLPQKTALSKRPYCVIAKEKNRMR